MASSVESWMRELNDASRLTDDITSMISEKGSLPPSGPETQRHMSAIRRKITILLTKLDSLESILVKLPNKQPITEKELHKRQDMLSNLRSKAKQMASALNMSNFATREDLLGQSKKSDEINRTSGLDNHGIVVMQRQIMKEQDEGLEKLEETVLSTKHIALAVNEELDLQTRLIDNLDEHVDVTDSRLQALALGICEGIWIQNLLRELRHDNERPILIYCDNQAAISIAKNTIHLDRTKHIEIDIHFISEKNYLEELFRLNTFQTTTK